MISTNRRFSVLGGGLTRSNSLSDREPKTDSNQVGVQEIADYLGISRGTVDRALRNWPGVPTKTSVLIELVEFRRTSL